MEITLDKQSANQASVKIKLNEADYQQQVDAKVKDYARKASIKGFRPGKAPISMVQKLYGTSVLVDEINDILTKSLNEFIKAQDFKILGDPLPLIEEAEQIDWKLQKDFEFKYKIGFVEGIQINLDKNTNATSYSLEMDDKTVQDAIENMSRQYGKMTNPETSQENDFLYGDLKAVDGSFEKTLSLPLSKIDSISLGDFIGIQKGAVIEFDPTTAIKEELASTLNITEEEAGQVSGKFTFTVQNINRTENAELNQELFDKVFGEGVIDSEAAFRERVKSILFDNYTNETKAFNDEKIKEALVSSNSIELPEAFLKEWLYKANEGKVTEEQVEEEFPIYAKQLTWSLISNQIANDNAIKAEHEDVIEKTKEMIRKQFSASGLSSQMEDSMDMFVNNYLQGNEGQNYMQLMTSVLNEKVLDFAREKIDVTEEVVSIDKFKELLEN